MKTIVTHSGDFHTDDVFAVATLFLLDEIKVIRSRESKDIDSADFVVDVGMIYEPEKRRFDHHQMGGAGSRENGIPYASFGLVWKEFGEKLSGGKKEADLIDRKLVQSIDAKDNGVSVSEYLFSNLREYTISDFIYSFKNGNDLNTEQMYELFMSSVEIAKGILVREIEIAKKTISGEEIVRKIYNESLDKRIIILEKELPWRFVLTETSDALFVIYKGNDSNWRARAVSKTSNSFENRVSFPELWGGKRDEELQQISGVTDAVFCARQLFTAVAKSKEGAIALANKALEN